MTKLHGLMLGVVLAVAVAVLLHLPMAHFGIQLLALLLSFTACAYVGAILAQRQSAVVIIAEIAICILVFLCAILGVVHSGYWLASGYVLHGIWDWAHERGMVSTKVAKWFPKFCAAFDLLIAGFILLFAANGGGVTL